MKISMHRILMATALTAIAAAGTAAQAQDDTGAESGALVDTGEIVVTAQRRSERLQDVPMSITALSQDTLTKAGVTSTPDLARVTPGLTMNFYGGFLQPAIRGVTSAGANVGESSNVATYIDGIYQPQQIATLFELPDVEQVEVLKGPQGALYGQNATGGAILISSATPSFTPHGRFSASYGNYNNIDLRGYVTTGLSDSFAVSLAAGYHDHDGYRRHVVTGERDKGLESKVVRGKILFQQSDAAKLTLTGYYSDILNSAMYAGFAVNNNSIGYGTDASAVFGLPAGSLPIPASPKVNRAGQFSASPDVFTRVKSWGTSLKGEFDLGFGKLNGVVSYTHNKASYRADADYSPVNFAEASAKAIPGNYVVGDINLASREFGPVSFLVGAFYLAGSETFEYNTFTLYFPNLPPAAKVPLAQSDTLGRIEKEIMAGYGEITLRPVEKLFITAGGRYTHERQRGFSDFGIPNNVLPYPGNPVIFNKFTPRITARYAIADHANVYASWGKGFKSGGINLTRYDLPPFDPENIEAWEIGFKGRLADTLNVNLSGFWYNYKDLQIVQYAPPSYYEENAASARIKGIDLDFNWRIAPGLTLSAGGTYLDAYYKEARATVNIPYGTGNIPTPDTDVSGNPLIRAPKFSGNVSLNYELDLSAGRLGAFASVYHNSGYAMEIQNRIRQPAYTTLDAEISFAPSAVEGLRVVLWGKNITDRAYYASLLQSQFGDGASYADPATYGVRAEFKF